MAGQLYRVVFEGEILEGSQVQEVKRALAKLYNTREDQVERFFSGKRLAVKKDVDYETAMKYVKAFERAGAVCRVEELETHTGLEQPLMLEKETEKPSQQDDVMVCPKCQFEQAPSEECVRCGIIVSKYSERFNAPESQTETHGKELSRSRPSSDPAASSANIGGGHRWLVSFTVVVLILAIAGVALFGYSEPGTEKKIGKISFYTEYDQGLDQAYDAGKPVMLVFSASWCGACKRMIRDVFSNDDVGDASGQLVNIYIDVDKVDRELVKDYGIKYVPSVFFLDYSGETIIQVADK